jgi:hypothetical protein
MSKSFIINKSMTKSVMITLLVLIFALVSYGQSGTIGSGNSTVINGQGRPLGGINVAVCAHPATGGYPCNNLATIYTDSTFNTILTGANPTTTDPQGNWGFYVVSGTWDVEFYGSGITSKTETLVTLSSLATTTISNGVAILGTGSITSGTCAAAVTVAATGVLTTDNIMADFNADPTGVTGYAPTANGILTIIKYPTTNNVNFKVCNNTGGNITPGAITLNWRVVR